MILNIGNTHSMKLNVYLGERAEDTGCLQVGQSRGKDFQELRPFQGFSP